MGVGLNWYGVVLCIVSCHFVLIAADTTTAAISGGDTCASLPCENGGTCTALPNAFICRCTDEYIGLRCETLYIANQGETGCSTMPCINGECVSSGSQQFTCMCPTGWRGNLCNIDVNECTTTTPCLNGGSCENVDGGYDCRCTVGYAGRNCEQDISCASNICNNNGTCILENEQPTCICLQGFSGQTCQDKVACSHDGDTFYDEEIRIDMCNQCHCRGGEWLCTKKFCGSILVMFDFNGDYSIIVQGNEDDFKSSLKTNIALGFSIEEAMIDQLMVSSGSIHVEFALVPLVESNLNIEDVAAGMLSTLESETYYFRYKGTSLFVDKSSVRLEKVEQPTEEPGNPAISNVTLVVVCVLVSVLLIMAVVIGTIVIIVHRKRSEKTSLGQFRGRDTKEEQPSMNNSNTRHHNDLYDCVPDEEDSTNGELKNINIDMFKVGNQANGRNLDPDHV